MIVFGGKSLHDSEYVKEAKVLVELAAQGQTHAIELSQKYFDMDKKYPNRGWANAGRKIHNRWAEKNGVSKI